MNQQERNQLRSRIEKLQNANKSQSAEGRMLHSLAVEENLQSICVIAVHLLDMLDKFEQGLTEAVQMVGDDLCWIDFAKLKSIFGVDFDPARLSRDTMMNNCSVFYDAMIAHKPYEADELTKRATAMCKIAVNHHKLLVALHDAIRRPMGVIPDSAIPFVTTDGLQKAEDLRRNHA